MRFAQQADVDLEEVNEALKLAQKCKDFRPRDRLPRGSLCLLARDCAYSVASRARVRPDVRSSVLPPNSCLNQMRRQP